METKFNFKSRVATDKIQSERLLALGLKKKTADMVHYMNGWGILATPWRDDYEGRKCYYPAWSLHRLLSMLPYDVPKIDWVLDGASIAIEFEDSYPNFSLHKGDIYERVVNCIEWLIKEGHFNKEYLL